MPSPRIFLLRTVWHYVLVGIWERFDALWFVHIAEPGYDQPMAVIFYPLYPASIRLFSAVMPATIAALVVATVAAFFAFWGLLRLASPELVGQEATLYWCWQRGRAALCFSPGMPRHWRWL